MQASGSTPNLKRPLGRPASDNLRSAGGSSQSIGAEGGAECRCLKVDHQRARDLVGYKDITTQLSQLGLIDDEAKAVLVPSPSFEMISQALDQLAQEASNIEAGRPLSREGTHALGSLKNLEAISYEKFSELSKARVEARWARAASGNQSAANLQEAAGRGATRSAENLLDPEQPSSSGPSNPPGNAPGRAHAAVARGAAGEPLSFSAPSTDSAGMRERHAAGAAFAVARAPGVVQAPNQASGCAQVRQSRYWPQRGMAWFFLTSLPLHAWGAVEYAMGVVSRWPAPNQNRRLLAYQAMIIPLGVFPMMAYIYLRMNRDRINEREASDPARNNPPQGPDRV